MHHEARQVGACVVAGDAGQEGLELAALSRRLLAEGIRRRYRRRYRRYDEQQLRLAFLRGWLGLPLFREAYQGAPEL